jgi:hypothetical protein
MQEREEVIRSRGGGLAMLQNGDQEFFERLLARFRVFQQANPVSPKEELKYFYYWLLKHSKAVVPIELYHKEMARLRVERDGDRQLLVVRRRSREGKARPYLQRRHVNAESSEVASSVGTLLPRYAGKRRLPVADDLAPALPGLRLHARTPLSVGGCSLDRTRPLLETPSENEPTKRGQP